MRRILSFASVATVILAAATPAFAQGDGERIFRGILEGLLAPQLQQGQTQQQQQQQAQPAARFDITNLAGRATCSLVLTGAGDSGTVTPQAGCPGVLATSAQWRRVDTNLELRNSASQVVWRGEPAPQGGGWTGGAADTLRAYTVTPGAAVAGPAAQAQAAAFDPATLYGDWRAAEPGQTRGCRVTFVQPDRNNRFAIQNAVRSERGCPAYIGSATHWHEAGGTLTLTDQSGAVQAQLTRTSADRWVGQSDGVDIILTRL